MTDPITPERIAELRAKLEAMTPGRWGAFVAEKGQRTVCFVQPIEVDAEFVDIVAEMPAEWHDHAQQKANAKGIAALRNAAPALLERVVALEDEVERLERELAAVRSEGPLAKPRSGGGVVD